MPEKVIFTHERPPIPTRGHDWRAGFDGREEEGRDGFGATKLAAAVDLYQHCETPEEVLACVVAILRADLESRSKSAEGQWSKLLADGFRSGMESAIRTVEGIA